MAEESGPLESLGKILPSVYYDLIARVCPGVSFLAALLWDRRDLIGELTWVKVVPILGAGYIAGFLLTPLSLPWGLVQFLLRRILKMPARDWRHGMSLYDAVAVEDREAGATLVKMQAEAVLCQNLFGGLVALIAIDATHLAPVPFIESCSRSGLAIILTILAVASIHRMAAYLVREKRLHKIHVEDRKGPRNSAATAAG